MAHHHQPWLHLLHAAHHASHRGHHKAAGLLYMVIGFFLTPILIGIPLMLYGALKLAK